MSVLNEKVLNINTIVSNADKMEDLQSINSIVNANLSSKYRIVKYLGEGIQGNLYLAIDNENRRYICKKIHLQANSSGYNQFNFELSVLKYLSNNSTTREHVNPCLEYSILGDNAYTMFPVFDGYSLSHYKQYLLKLQHRDYYRLVFYLIKSVLHGMAKIHKTHIAHQNLNENAILIATNLKPGTMFVKFTDFGLGCGGNPNSLLSGIGNMVDVSNYKNDTYFNITSCKDNVNVPITISSNIREKLSESEYLKISQKYDLLCLGIIFLKLLLFFENINLHPEQGYSNELIQKLNEKLGKYIHKPKYRFSFLNISIDIKQHILAYLKFFIKYIFCKTHDRRSCQYILDKIIIYEKYKHEHY